MKLKKIIILFLVTFSTITFSEKAPNFKLKDQYNVIQTLKEYRGKTIILVFWGSYCSACKDELPIIEEVYKEYGENKQNVIILGVNKEDSDKMKSFLRKNKYSFPTVLDEDTQVIKQYLIELIPTILFIDSKGKIVEKFIGSLEKNQIEEIIAKINSNI